jgi:hypothetical protein
VGTATLGSQANQFAKPLLVQSRIPGVLHSAGQPWAAVPNQQFFSVGADLNDIAALTLNDIDALTLNHGAYLLRHFYRMIRMRRQMPFALIDRNGSASPVKPTGITRNMPFEQL